MKAEYDFTKGVRNPYAKRVKRAVTIRLETEVIDYFKARSAELGIPYQNLINLYLRDCMQASRRPVLSWKKPVSSVGEP